MEKEDFVEKLEKILSEVQGKPGWMYLQEFRHQAPHLSKKKFREEIYDYVEAAETERMGIEAGVEMALKRADNEYSDFSFLCKAVLTELREHFIYLKSLPYGSPESPHMYKWGFEKVIKKVESII